MEFMTVQELARQIGRDISSVHRMLKKRLDIKRYPMIQRPSGQTVMTITQTDGEKLVKEFEPGLHLAGTK